MLAMCLTGLFIHGFLPDSMLSIVLVPVVKDKSGKISQKVVEIILLRRIFCFLKTSCCQFGFQTKLGTDMCVYM